MFKTNVGRLDRALRIAAGVILALVGLFPLGGTGYIRGWQFKMVGPGLPRTAWNGGMRCSEGMSEGRSRRNCVVWPRMGLGFLQRFRLQGS